MVSVEGYTLMAKTHPWDSPEFDDSSTGAIGAHPWDSPEFDDPSPSSTPQSTAVPLAPDRKAKLDADIAATSLPQKSNWDRIVESTLESTRSAASQFNKKALFGIPDRVLQAVGNSDEPAQTIPEAGKAKRPEDYVPSNALADMGTSLAAAGVDMSTMGGAVGKAGETIGQAPAALARKLGASEAATSVRPSLQTAANAGGAGALYSGADTAVHGGSPSDVLASMPVGAAANIAMSQIPAVAGAVEDVAAPKVVASELRSIKRMSKKGSLDKSLEQFGNGDAEVGARNMQQFAENEGLGKIFSEKGEKLISKYNTKKHDVWDKDLAPIYKYATEAEPKAVTPIGEVESRLRANIKVRGSDQEQLVNKSIDEIRKRATNINENGDVPLDSLLEIARNFQSKGHAGVVNYDAPTPAKMEAREIGRTLRTIANERVAQIYRRNPEAAFKLFTGEESPAKPGVTFRDQPSTPGMVRADQYPDDWARRYSNLQEFASSVPQKLADGNRRYSDYAKLEPLVEQAAKLKAGEKRFGLWDLINHSVTGSAAAGAGYVLGGPEGAAMGVGGLEAGRAMYPHMVKGAAGASGAISGPAVSPYLSGAALAKMTLPQLKEYAASMPQRDQIARGKMMQEGYEKRKSFERKKAGQ